MPDWVGGLLGTDFVSWTLDVISEGMQKEFSAVMDLAISRLLIEEEVLQEKINKLQSEADECVSKRSDLESLKEQLIASFEDLQDLKKEVQVK
ncbi:MAG: hypothetical protein KAS01_02975 [Candidatus Pacebacteria bacterium]|nr:hypothetical protein [Candidatus Paceibacterota bacterium]